MKICFFSDAIAEHTRRWVKFFAQNGHEVHLISFNEKKLDDYNPVNVHIILKRFAGNNIISRLLNFLFIYKDVKKVVKEINPNVVHAHSVTSYSWIVMLCKLHPYVVTPWGTDVLIDMKKSFFNRMISKRTLSKADYITTDAHHVKDEMINFNIEKSKIEIIMFGFDLNRVIQKQDNWKEKMREKYKLGNSKLIISTRTLNPVHDVGTFIKSIPEIHTANPDVKFICLTDGIERAKLEKLSYDLGLDKFVLFPGYVSETDMMRWLLLSSIYVSTSLADAGLAASTAEAMACRLPVVSTTENSDNHHWILEDKGGFLVNNGDYKAIAQKVNLLLLDNELRINQGNFNREVIEEKNNYEIEMGKMNMIYDKLVK